MKKEKGILTRTAENKDIPHLKVLWKTVFGDDDTDIDHFFGTYFSPELSVVIDSDGASHGGAKPVSAAYILPAGDLVLPQVCTDIGQISVSQFVPDHGTDRRYGCAMLYAIATLPEYRGRGYGESVTQAATELAFQKGYPAVVLKPADDGLFEFYEKRADFREFFDAHIAELTDAELLLPDPRYAVSPVSPAAYRRLRNGLLAGAVFIDMDERGLLYQQYLCAKAGGGLYELLYDGARMGSAVIEREDDTVRIKELLLTKDCRMTDAVSAISKLLAAKKYEVRMPFEAEEAGKRAFRRFGMMSPIPGRPDIPYVYSAKWYGLAFD